MRSPSALLLLAALILVTWGLAAACAEGNGEAPQPAASAPVAPRKPPNGRVALGCRSDADCLLSQYVHPVVGEDGCYCLPCPQPTNAWRAATQERDWQQICGQEWAAAHGCQAPMCPPPDRGPVCSEGVCSWREGVPSGASSGAVVSPALPMADGRAATASDEGSSDARGSIGFD